MEPEVDHQFFSDAEAPEETAVVKSKPEAGAGKRAKKQEQGPKKRYLVFIGNLPYTIEKGDLEKLFKDIEVMSIRLLSDKVTGKPRGIAFAEFPDAENMEKALALHQTKVKGRKVNIELTAGGGGKGAQRKEKIRTKNQRYKQERETTSRTTKDDE